MREHRCEKCGGMYQNPQRDGSLYIHVCPPARPPEPPRRTLWERVRERLFPRKQEKGG